MLREVAKRINAEMRVSDIGARFGGDEFSIVLPQADLQDGERVAQSRAGIRASTPIKIDGDKTRMSRCRSAWRSPSPSTTPRITSCSTERLLAEADAALYRSKQAGRNRVAVSRSIVT